MRICSMDFLLSGRNTSRNSIVVEIVVKMLSSRNTPHPNFSALAHGGDGISYGSNGERWSGQQRKIFVLASDDVR